MKVKKRNELLLCWKYSKKKDAPWWWAYSAMVTISSQLVAEFTAGGNQMKTESLIPQKGQQCGKHNWSRGPQLLPLIQVKQLWNLKKKKKKKERDCQRPKTGVSKVCVDDNTVQLNPYVAGVCMVILPQRWVVTLPISKWYVWLVQLVTSGTRILEDRRSSPCRGLWVRLGYHKTLLPWVTPWRGVGVTWLTSAQEAKQLVGGLKPVTLTLTFY